MFTREQAQLTATLNSSLIDTITSSNLYAVVINADSLSAEEVASAKITGIHSMNDLRDLEEAVQFIKELSEYKGIIQDFQVPVKYLKYITQFL